MTRKEAMEIKGAVMELIKDVLGSTIPPEKRAKIDEMGKAAAQLKDCLDKANPLPMCLVQRYNDLSRELFTPFDKDKDEGEDEDDEDCERYCVRECEDDDSDMPEQVSGYFPTARLVQIADWYVWVSPEGGLHVKYAEDEEDED